MPIADTFHLLPSDSSASDAGEDLARAIGKLSVQMSRIDLDMPHCPTDEEWTRANEQRDAVDVELERLIPLLADVRPSTVGTAVTQLLLVGYWLDLTLRGSSEQIQERSEHLAQKALGHAVAFLAERHSLDLAEWGGTYYGFTPLPEEQEIQS